MLKDAVILSSGATFQMQLAPFALAKDLYQSMLRTLGVTQLSKDFEVASVVKDFFILGFSSKEIEKYVWACFAFATYNDTKIDKDTFESEEARGDYVRCIVEVVTPNVLPFFKSLFVEYSAVQVMIDGIQESKSKKTETQTF